MAKQKGAILLSGSLSRITFYEFGGKHYARSKSSLDKKRFNTDPAFTRSQASSKRFSQANKLASEVYRQVSKEQKSNALFCLLKSTAIRLVNQYMDPSEILSRLKQLLPQPEAS
ncbi:MAG TPA: hypothetical protein VK941_09400, partial [Gillisia sp.]|nr:hypothetical protein [Gillisia sp.]